MKKIMFIWMIFLLAGCTANKFDGEFRSYSEDSGLELSILDIETQTYDDLIDRLGKADIYFYGERIFNPDELPDYFMMTYNDQVTFVIRRSKVLEMRIHQEGPVYRGLYLGQDGDEALLLLNKPQETVENIHLYFKEDVLYTKIKEEDESLKYYHDSENKVTVYIEDGKVSYLVFIGDQTMAIKSKPEILYSKPGHTSGMYMNKDYIYDHRLVGYWSYLDFVYDLSDFEPGKTRSSVKFTDLNVKRGGYVKDTSLMWTKDKFTFIYDPLNQVYPYEIKSINDQEYLVLSYLKDEVVKGYYIFTSEDVH